MFTVHHYNFGTKQDFATLDYAVAFARRAYFEATIWHNGTRVADFNPITGLVTYH
jgi:hypothetical protein